MEEWQRQKLEVALGIVTDLARDTGYSRAIAIRDLIRETLGYQEDSRVSRRN